MGYKRQIEELVERVIGIAKAKNKVSGFCIGNTAKVDKSGMYFTPVRNTSRMVIAGAIVYGERQAIDVAKVVDGKVDYILVDTEKKVPARMSRAGTPANVERAVRETVKRSTLWVYKGNDLAVEAVDSSLSYLTKDLLGGIGGRKIAILGAGNLGCKLALKLVERGAHVFITRRNAKKVRDIARVLNYIKPKYTTAKVIGMTDNEKASKGADVLIGLTQGIPVVTSRIINNLSSEAVAIDGGKGTFYPAAIKLAQQRGIKIYRLDVSAAFEGLIGTLFSIENTIEKRMGRRLLNDEHIVAGGLMGKKGDIVVDNAYEPKIIYGIADGKGDFVRNPSAEQLTKVTKIKKAIGLVISL